MIEEGEGRKDEGGQEILMRGRVGRNDRGWGGLEG